ncbi:MULTISPECIES: pyruvate dehydrogenase (acetyl-transferring), homodimeric type [Cysteiniphilum]|uniref:Pyruvate dehydrogenase E1 component n=1 Tax=Cysteiniphilum litorale TaxID=2056700 RepID=A0A8J3E8Q2_9GAMM|nr:MULTISPECIES: pyruvate dehydrogenase (acetyl-transferring), homodimeric type [Cysteiniphilum]GGF95116.1 pyruvate dehydrogenase E1 component [Cysteiniphilum litorale]
MSERFHDIDTTETQEWLEALEDVVTREGAERASFLVNRLLDRAGEIGIDSAYAPAKSISFMNTIKVADQPGYPGDLEVEKKIENLNRWNAAVMVAKANKKDGTLGGHIGSGASIMTLYEVGFNHFFHAPSETKAGDLVFYQGHTTPVIYARSYLEGRLTEEQLKNFRQQAFNGDKGLSSYPHPYLQPTYWQFPTVSMGLGPLQAIYQARFMKYLEARKLAETSNRRVWAFCGDGEMDEPESLGAINRAAREGLDNLIFVINCNLQRLDGLVDGNGKIVEEFAQIFTGAGWNVIKVLWGSNWEPLFAKDTNGKLQQRLAQMNDGQMQFARSHGGQDLRQTIFGGDPELEEMGKGYTDEDVQNLMRGGHDPIKVYAAYQRAVNNTTGKPTVILPMTIKGYGLGEWGESKNIAHNVKKLDTAALKYIRDRFDVPATDEQVENMEFVKFQEGSKEHAYLHAQRKALDGYAPARFENNTALPIPSYQDFGQLFLEASGDREFSTTTAFVRMFVNLTRHKELKDRLVPVTVDESRTFGMEGLFRQLGIYNHRGQQYVPEDKAQVMYYKESTDGQIIQDGINEAGGFCSWLAAATSYSAHRVPMIPFYIYYSMFGFQRIGDLAWLAGDSHAKGFLLGGTAGRTTLNGEGLQHEDGHSHIQASLIPSCISYDPTYAYELAVILWDGMRRMYVEGEQVFYYVTVMNENYVHGAMPEGSEEGIIKGLYLLKGAKKADAKKHVQLMGSGTILREVEAAAELLEKDFGVTSDVWSMTSANELYRDSRKVARWNMLHPDKKAQQTHIEKCLKGHTGPVIASTDYIKLYTEQLREFMPTNYITLGTDGFGRSDSRENLRSFFEVDRYHVVIAALTGLLREGAVTAKVVKDAIKKYNIDPERLDPLSH